MYLWAREYPVTDAKEEAEVDTVNFKSLGTSRLKVKRKRRGNGIYRKHYLYGGGVALYARVVLSRCYFVVLVVALKSKLASC